MTTQRGWLAGLSVLLSMGSALEVRAAQQAMHPRSSSPVAMTTNWPVQNDAPAAQSAAARPRGASPVSAEKYPTSAIPHPSPTPECSLVPQPERAYPDISLGLKLLWYIPNRLIDFADIFRLRLRFGPGLAANARVTDYGSLYYGKYCSVYAGLPGPRNPYYARLPLGVECLDGVVIGGVDATDDTPYGPAYGPTEVDVGLHLLVVGAEFGVDPLEIADFLSGLLMVDLEHDDYPRPRSPEPVTTSGVSAGTAKGLFQVAPKPAKFDDLIARLDYLHTNVQQRVSKPLRAADEYFAPDAQQRVEVPDSRLRLGIYTEFIRGRSFDISFKPDVDLDVSLPNMERKLHLFVQSARVNDLPGRSLSETSNKGLTLGARSRFKAYDISTDAGIHDGWPPHAYARLTWHPMYEFENWSFRPQQRVFFDTRDKLGTLSTLYVDRWLGVGHDYYIGSLSSVRYVPFKDHDEINPDDYSPGDYIPYEGDLTWEQTFRVGRVRKMLEERAYVGMYERRDIASGSDIAASIFGTDSHIDTYRITVGMRRPLYQEWIYLEIEPGFEWTAENDYETAFRITLGVDMLFWGPTSK